MIVVGIAVVAGLDVMREPGPPAEAVVGVVVGENVVEPIERQAEMIARAAGEMLELRAVEPHPHDAAPFERQCAAVGPGGLGNPLVAARDVDQPVHPQMNARHDMIVEPIDAGRRPETLGQILAHVGHAVAGGVAEHRVMRGVHHVQRPVVPDQAEHGRQMFGRTPS